MAIQLIDYLAYKLNCSYVSNLKAVPGYMIQREVSKIRADECTLKEWVDLAVYLYNEKKDFRSVQEARNYILTAEQKERQ